MTFKELLKSNDTIIGIYNGIEKFCGHFFPLQLSNYKFKKTFGKKINFENPLTLNEKLMYYKFNLYWNNPLIAICADKFRVRDYISECGQEKILNKLIGVWSNPNEIDWDSLPNKFAIKCNHGSGYNIICKDKSKFDSKKAVKTLQKWLKETYGYNNAEQGIYSKIDRKIIIEEYIETPNDLPPNDYKFFCSYGNVEFLFVASDRYEGKTKFDYYYPDWEWIDVKNAHPNKGPIEKPSTFDEMIEIAKILSKPFPLVRVDLYSIKDSIIFGELTFTHFGCIHGFEPEQYDLTFGKLLPDVHEANELLYNGHIVEQ